MGKQSFIFQLRSAFGLVALKDHRLLASSLSPLKRVLESFGAAVDRVVQYDGRTPGIYPAVFAVRVAQDKAQGLLQALKSEDLRDIVADARYEPVPDDAFFLKENEKNDQRPDQLRL